MINSILNRIRRFMNTDVYRRVTCPLCTHAQTVIFSTSQPREPEQRTWICHECGDRNRSTISIDGRTNTVSAPSSQIADTRGIADIDAPADHPPLLIETRRTECGQCGFSYEYFTTRATLSPEISWICGRCREHNVESTRGIVARSIGEALRDSPRAGIPGSLINIPSERREYRPDSDFLRWAQGHTQSYPWAGDVIPFSPKSPEKKKKEEVKPKPIKDTQMKREYDKLSDSIKKQIKDGWVGTSIEVSATLKAMESSDYKRHKKKMLMEAFFERLINHKSLEDIKERETSDGGTIYHYELYAFTQEEWLKIISNVFYAGFDYAKEQLKPNTQEDKNT